MMRGLLRSLLVGRALWVYGTLWCLILVMSVSTLATFGSFQSIGYTDDQNTAFGRAIRSQQPLKAIEEAPPASVEAIKLDLIADANETRRSPDIPPEFDVIADDAAGAEALDRWRVDYLCAIKGWSEDHRPVVRALVVAGYGRCGDAAEFRARAPFFYAGVGGALFWTYLPAAFLGTFLLLLILTLVVRRAYRWLYASNVFQA